MVRQVKIFICVVGLIAALCGTVQAATHTVYENGSLGTTYITYFKDILSGSNLMDNYIAFRSGQNEYTMIVGRLKNENGVISLTDKGKQYRYYTTSINYNSQYYYDVSNISNFSLVPNNSIIYSDVGDFPELVERGAKYEILSTILLCIFGCCFIIRCIFYKR